MIYLLSNEVKLISLKYIPLWIHSTTPRDCITRQFMFNNFNESWKFMCKVSKISKKMNHHPEWININKIVIITLITHDKGGITNKDIELAYNIDQLS